MTNTRDENVREMQRNERQERVHKCLDTANGEVKYATEFSDMDGSVEITLYKSLEDGKLVIQIDTPDFPEDENGPLLRVNLNDSTATKFTGDVPF